jgi:Flp pilus assembly protein TadG
MKMVSKHPISARRSLGRRNQKGSSLVESTLCFLGFMFLTLGMMEFSMAVYAYNFVTYASSVGARWASMHGTNSATPATTDSVQTLVRNQAISLIRSNLSVATTWSPDNQPGSIVQVTVSYTIIPLVHLALRNNMSVRSTSKVVIAN